MNRYLHDLARHSFEEEARNKDNGVTSESARMLLLVFEYVLVLAIIVTLCGLVFAPVSHIFAIVLAIVSCMFYTIGYISRASEMPRLLSSAFGLVFASKFVEQRMEAYTQGDPEVTCRIYALAVDEYREQLRRHRIRTLGKGSEWQKARTAVAGAAKRASKAAAYWRVRLMEEPDNELAMRQYRVASRLRSKLESAVGQLDKRGVAFRRFHAQCSAKVDAMERQLQDAERSEELEELLATVEVTVAEAESTGMTIAQEFVRDAETMAEVLGDLSEVGTTNLAAFASIENIEQLADQIVEQSDWERAVVQGLDARLSR